METAPKPVSGSLWVRPSGSALARIDDAIRIVRAHAGGIPAWPHVSLLGGFTAPPALAQVKLEALARGLAPFQVRLGPLGWRKEFYRSLYFEVEETPGLLRAHRLAHEVFGMPLPAAYEPHVSLVYADIDVPEKERLATLIGGASGVSFEARAVDFVNASEAVPIPDWKTLFSKPFG